MQADFKTVAGIVITAVFLAWFIGDYTGSTQVITSSASAFNTSVRALEPPSAAGASLPAGAN